MKLDHITFAHRPLFCKSVLREGFEPARLSNSPKTIPQGGTAPMSLMSRMLTDRKYYIGVTFTRISSQILQLRIVQAISSGPRTFLLQEAP